MNSKLLPEGRKYLVAVSGGVDSVVLLDMLVHEGGHNVTVAHFDHGIREDSAADARFVEGLAQKYGLPFISKREELGKTASEEQARSRRYAFLFEEAKKRGVVVVTAHHSDDIIETIAINIKRGTGWRGLAVLDSPALARPLLAFSKADIREYALKSRLEWVEDSTNSEDIYLRNRLRRQISQLTTAQKQKIIGLWKRQREFKRAIDTEVTKFIKPTGEYERYTFIYAESPEATELLRGVITAKTGKSPTRPQCERALMAVKVAQVGTTFEVGDGVFLTFKAKTFIVNTP